MGADQTYNDIKLAEWLDDVGAMRLWTNSALKGFTLQGWNVRGFVVIVQKFDAGGWDVYMPVTASNNINATLRSLEAQIRELQAGR